MPGKDYVPIVSNMFRPHCPEGGPASSTYLQANPEVIIEKMEPIIKELVMLKEVRKIGKFLQECAQIAFPRMISAECKLFGERLLAACEHIVVKRKSATTGKKTPQPVYRIILAMNANDLPSEPVVPPALPCHTTPDRSVVKRKDSISTISSQPSMPSSSKAIPKVTSAENVASFYNDMLGVVEGGEEECEEDDDVVSISSEDAGPTKITSQYTSTYDMAMVRVLSNGNKVLSRMKTGPNGFAIATFEGSDNEHVTEIPNSTLLKHQETTGKKNASPVVAKKPSMNSSKKRPAAVLSKTKAADSLEQAPAVGNASLHLQGNTDLYQVMVYKAHDSWAIRQRTGEKKQICSIAVKGRSPEQMLTVVKEAIQRLASGEDKDAVKAWLKT